MTVSSFGDGFRARKAVAGTHFRALRSRLRNSLLYRMLSLSGSAERLLLAPQDIRTADPTVANEIYQGRYSIGGDVAMVNGSSPFEIVPPSAEWRRALTSFGWLRHLRASNSSLARAQARTLIADWMATEGRRGESWDVEITARRVMAWLCHSPLILEGANRTYYRRFLRSLGHQVRYLRRTARDAPDGLPRLTAIVALNYAGLCIGGMTRLQRSAASWLDSELVRQVLPDGGHVSRNPGALVQILLDLLPLRQTFSARSIEPPSGLIHAIDRMMPMIRFFRHGDGSFALFNGMSATPVDEIATVLAYDDAFGKPLANAMHSGYQRMTAGDAVVLMDTGYAPPMRVSRDAHAGCLSFEFSHGANRIIVNCGAAAAGGSDWQRAGRVTAAHSTLVVEDTSSCRFIEDVRYSDIIGSPIVSGPAQITVERSDSESSHTVTASHDGYRQRFSTIHERQLTLRGDGTRLVGQDRLRGGKAVERVNPGYALRFHLHPEVRASSASDSNVVVLKLGQGETWVFAVKDGTPVLEESIHLAERNGPRRARQIVIYGTYEERPQINWVLERVKGAEAVSKQAEEDGGED